MSADHGPAWEGVDLWQERVGDTADVAALQVSGRVRARPSRTSRSGVATRSLPPGAQDAVALPQREQAVGVGQVLDVVLRHDVVEGSIVEGEAAGRVEVEDLRVAGATSVLNQAVQDVSAGSQLQLLDPVGLRYEALALASKRDHSSCVRRRTGQGNLDPRQEKKKNESYSFVHLGSYVAMLTPFQNRPVTRHHPGSHGLYFSGKRRPEDKRHTMTRGDTWTCRDSPRPTMRNSVVEGRQGPVPRPSTDIHDGQP